MSPSNKLHSSHLLVIIALEEEFDYFKTVLNVQLSTEIIDGIKVQRFQLPAREGLAEGVVTVIGDMGNENSNSLANKLIPKLHPKLLINIGISGLLSDDLRLGDVVIATEANDYTHRSKLIPSSDAELTSSEIEFGGETSNSPDWLIEHTKQLENSIIETWRSYAITNLRQALNKANFNFLKQQGFIEENKTPSLHRGPVASGPFVVGSKAFKKILLDHNRNFLAVDMESFGVLKAADQHQEIEALVLRGISDFADERKKRLDRIGAGALRRWAMTNASQIFVELIKSIDLGFQPIPISQDFQDYLERELHRTIIEKHLPQPYTQLPCMESGSCSWQTFSQFFSIACDTSLPNNTYNLFEDIAKDIQINSLNRNVALQVEGASGTGKTSFLSLLYWYFSEQHTHKNTNLLPVFINFHIYNKFPSKDEVMSELKQNLQPLKSIIDYFPAQPLLIIIDGFDIYARFKDFLSSYLLNLIQPCSYCKIIGLRLGSDLSENPNKSISLKSIRVSEPSYPQFIQAFLSISRPRGLNEESLKRIIEEDCQLTEVDLFTLGLLVEKIKKTGHYDFYLALIRYCREFVQERFPDAADKQRQTLLLRAAQLALEDEVGSEPRKKQSEDSILRELSSRHSILRDFLIAYHAVESLLKIYDSKSIFQKREKPLKFIYPYRITKLCKLIINRDSNTQQKVNDVIRRLLQEKTIHPNIKINGCYFAGRFNDKQIRNIAERVLGDFKQELAEKATFQELDKHDLFLFRSLHISLILLGNSWAKSNYIKYLLTGPKGEHFNRGFHLEYYGDQPYRFTIEELTSKDLLDNFTNTWEKLSKNIIYKTDNPLFEIELHTLCSLAQHRHEVGKLDPTVRANIIKIIDEVKDKVDDNGLRTYISVIYDHLKHEKFHIAHIFKDYYQIKSLPRTGWVKRGISNGETVAAHTYGAYLLALFLLPDKWEYPDYPNYDKQMIMNMLLIHDLAEAKVGDIPSQDRTPQHDQQEREEYEKIGMLGTYDGLSIMHKLAEWWSEFEDRQTTNSKVAKDIDLLENLVQLRVYQDEGYKIDDFDSWSQSLIENLRTPLGRDVLKKLDALEDNRK